jgi:hypothetical protein
VAAVRNAGLPVVQGRQSAAPLREWVQRSAAPDVERARFDMPGAALPSVRARVRAQDAGPFAGLSAWLRLREACCRQMGRSGVRIAVHPVAVRLIAGLAGRRWMYRLAWAGSLVPAWSRWVPRPILAGQ